MCTAPCLKHASLGDDIGVAYDTATAHERFSTSVWGFHRDNPIKIPNSLRFPQEIVVVVI